MIVKSELDKLGLHYGTVDLGVVNIVEDINIKQRNQLKIALARSGLELLDNKKSILIEKIKKVVVELVHYSEQPLKVNFPDFLSTKLKHDYSYLANLFSEVTGITIEHYYNIHKVERVKELLIYEGFSVSKIFKLMNYSSVAQLSRQFKKVTGLTPGYFKKLKRKKYNSLK